VKRAGQIFGRLMCRLGVHHWRATTVITGVELQEFLIPGGLYGKITDSHLEVRCRFCNRREP
jgi:hypothetical protein